MTDMVYEVSREATIEATERESGEAALGSPVVVGLARSPGEAVMRRNLFQDSTVVAVRATRTGNSTIVLIAAHTLDDHAIAFARSALKAPVSSNRRPRSTNASNSTIRHLVGRRPGGSRGAWPRSQPTIDTTSATCD